MAWLLLDSKHSRCALYCCIISLTESSGSCKTHEYVPHSNIPNHRQDWFTRKWLNRSGHQSLDHPCPITTPLLRLEIALLSACLTQASNANRLQEAREIRKALGCHPLLLADDDDARRENSIAAGCQGLAHFDKTVSEFFQERPRWEVRAQERQCY